MTTLTIAPVSHLSSDNDVVRCDIFIAAPRERIFEALTDPKQAVRWWGQNGRHHLSEFQLDARVGGKWSTSGSSQKMGSIKIEGELLELDPPCRLTYTWISSWMPRKTTVLWELEPRAGGTLVKLTHTGFDGDAQLANAHIDGWIPVLGWLQSFVERGETISTRT